MKGHIHEMMKGVALAAAGSRSNARHAIVTAYDPTHYAIKAAIQPENTETGWLPIGSAWIGAGWGIVCPPSINDMVELIPVEGQSEAWIVGHRFYNDHDTPPASVPCGEFLLQHKSGSLLHFANDGSVTLVTEGAMNLTVGATLTSSAAQWIHTGPVQINGQLNVTAGVTAGYGTGDSVTLQHHTHNQPPDGHGDTEAPTNAPNAGT